MKRYILLFISLITLLGCARGTGTGNPIQNASAPVQNTVSGLVFYYTCQVLMKCNPGLSGFTCGTGIENVVGFAVKLGATDNSLTAGQIVSEESQNQLTGNAVQGDKCSAALLRLSCSDIQVQQAYDPASPQPFAKAPEMLDSVCTGVFGP